MKSAFSLWVEGILSVLFGIFVIMQPATVLNIASILFSLVLVWRGLGRVIDAIRFHKYAVKVIVNGAVLADDIQKKIRQTMLIDGIVALVIGCAAFGVAAASFKTGGEALMKGVVYVNAAGFLITGIANMIESHSLRPYDELSRVFRVNSIVFFTAAAVLFAFPFFVGHTVMTVFGIIVIVLGVSSFVWGTRIFVETKKIKKALAEVEKKK